MTSDERIKVIDECLVEMGETLKEDGYGGYQNGWNSHRSEAIARLEKLKTNGYQV